MRRVLAPILFDDHDKASANAECPSLVAPSLRCAARRKAAGKRTDDGLPVLSFRSLIDALATVTHNTMAMPDCPDARFVLYPQFTPLQACAFQFLGTAVKTSPGTAPPNPTQSRVRLTACASRRGGTSV